MNRVRLVFLTISLLVVILFTGVIVGSREAKEELFQALGNLAEVVHLIRTEYVDELNPEALQLSLDAGIVESIDRWSAVLNADQVDTFNELMQSPPPYGLVVSSRLGSAAVRFVMPGSAADEAGLVTWEVIERVDGVYTRGRPLWQLRLELFELERAGKPVMLTVLDQQVEERREVELLPTDWQPNPAAVEVRDGVLVVRVDGLPEGSVDHLTELLGQPQSVVVDLRDLVWGIEEEAIAVADLFASEGILGGWRGRRAGAQSYAASDDSLIADPPAVLIGPNTEGVGEILAAALQRAGSTVVGTRSIGHAPHMRMIQDGELNLWIPVGDWLRGDEEKISGNGVEPDEVVEPGGEGEDEDPVLDRALELTLDRALELKAQPLEQAA
jgi:carboxyl-terminal processing protease